MDKDRVKGGTDQAKGRLQKAAGDVTGDQNMKAKGAINEAKGKVETAAGKVKDAVRKATK